MRTKGLTSAQMKAYFKAAIRGAQRIGEDINAYRKRVMKEECGVSSSKDLNRTTDFDKVMKRFNADAGDYEAAIKYALADEHRIAVLVAIVATQVIQLKNIKTRIESIETSEETCAFKYLAGILKQSRINLMPCEDGTFWFDIPKRDIRSVFQILDTYRVV